jgi:hypothetical protein
MQAAGFPAGGDRRWAKRQQYSCCRKIEIMDDVRGKKLRISGCLTSYLILVRLVCMCLMILFWHPHGDNI